jgi:hypothetical protein
VFDHMPNQRGGGLARGNLAQPTRHV